MRRREALRPSTRRAASRVTVGNNISPTRNLQSHWATHALYRLPALAPPPVGRSQRHQACERACGDPSAPAVAAVCPTPLWGKHLAGKFDVSRRRLFTFVQRTTLLSSVVQVLAATVSVTSAWCGALGPRKDCDKHCARMHVNGKATRHPKLRDMHAMPSRALSGRTDPAGVTLGGLQHFRFSARQRALLRVCRR